MIDPCYLSDVDDLAPLIEGLKLAQEIMQQTGMREQRLCCLGVRSDRGRLRRKPVDPLLQRLDGIR